MKGDIIVPNLFGLRLAKGPEFLLQFLFIYTIYITFQTNFPIFAFDHDIYLQITKLQENYVDNFPFMVYLYVRDLF